MVGPRLISLSSWYFVLVLLEVAQNHAFVEWLVFVLIGKHSSCPIHPWTRMSDCLKCNVETRGVNCCDERIRDSEIVGQMVCSTAATIQMTLQTNIDPLKFGEHTVQATGLFEDSLVCEHVHDGAVCSRNSVV